MAGAFRPVDRAGLAAHLAERARERSGRVRVLVDGAPLGPTSIRVPTHAGRDGHPVVFGAAHLAALAALDADRGARSILEANPQDVERVAVGGDGILRDVDTPDALEEARRR